MGRQESSEMDVCMLGAKSELMSGRSSVPSGSDANEPKKASFGLVERIDASEVLNEGSLRNESKVSTTFSSKGGLLTKYDLNRRVKS
jgi:hypothetical protein